MVTLKNKEEALKMLPKVYKVIDKAAKQMLLKTILLLVRNQELPKLVNSINKKDASSVFFVSKLYFLNAFKITNDKSVPISAVNN